MMIRIMWTEPPKPMVIADAMTLDHVLCAFSRDLLEDIFNERVDTDSITSIKEINPNLTKADIIKAFKN